MESLSLDSLTLETRLIYLSGTCPICGNYQITRVVKYFGILTGERNGGPDGTGWNVEVLNTISNRVRVLLKESRFSLSDAVPPSECSSQKSHFLHNSWFD